MKESLIQKTLDNITVVMVSFSGFERSNFNAERPELEYTSQTLSKTGFNGSALNQVDRTMGGSYTPLTGKSYLNSGNERILSATKKYDNVGNSTDYSGASSFSRSNGSFWKASS